MNRPLLPATVRNPDCTAMPTESVLPVPSVFLLVAGLIFPVLSLLTLLLSRRTQQRTGNNSSAILIPFIGPVLLTIWLRQSAWPTVLVPVVWLTDPGTLCFLILLPRLAAEWWRTSRFTRLLTFCGRNDALTVTLSLHRAGHYRLQQHWSPPAANGMVMSSETGRWVQDSATLLLQNSSRELLLLHIAGCDWSLLFPDEPTGCAGSPRPIRLQASGLLQKFSAT